MAAGRPASRATPRDTPTPWSRPRMCPEGDGSLLEITRRGEPSRPSSPGTKTTPENLSRRVSVVRPPERPRAGGSARDRRRV
jgi:hypothetical protein